MPFASKGWVAPSAPRTYLALHFWHIAIAFGGGHVVVPCGGGGRAPGRATCLVSLGSHRRRLGAARSLDSDYRLGAGDSPARRRRRARFSVCDGAGGIGQCAGSGDPRTTWPSGPAVLARRGVAVRWSTWFERRKSSCGMSLRKLFLAPNFSVRADGRMGTINVRGIDTHAQPVAMPAHNRCGVGRPAHNPLPAHNPSRVHRSCV
jgi:hypothetical protein